MKIHNKAKKYLFINKTLTSVTLLTILLVSIICMFTVAVNGGLIENLKTFSTYSHLKNYKIFYSNETKYNVCERLQITERKVYDHNGRKSLYTYDQKLLNLFKGALSSGRLPRENNRYIEVIAEKDIYELNKVYDAHNSSSGDLKLKVVGLLDKDKIILNLEEIDHRFIANDDVKVINKFITLKNDEIKAENVSNSYFYSDKVHNSLICLGNIYKCEIIDISIVINILLIIALTVLIKNVFKKLKHYSVMTNYFINDNQKRYSCFAFIYMLKNYVLTLLIIMTLQTIYCKVTNSNGRLDALDFTEFSLFFIFNLIIASGFALINYGKINKFFEKYYRQIFIVFFVSIVFIFSFLAFINFSKNFINEKQALDTYEEAGLNDVELFFIGNKDTKKAVEDGILKKEQMYCFNLGNEFVKVSENLMKYYQKSLIKGRLPKYNKDIVEIVTTADFMNVDDVFESTYSDSNGKKVKYKVVGKLKSSSLYFQSDGDKYFFLYKNNYDGTFYDIYLQLIPTEDIGSNNTFIYKDMDAETDKILKKQGPNHIYKKVYLNQIYENRKNNLLLFDNVVLIFIIFLSVLITTILFNSYFCKRNLISNYKYGVKKKTLRNKSSLILSIFILLTYPICCCYMCFLGHYQIWTPCILCLLILQLILCGMVWLYNFIYFKYKKSL